MKLKCEFVVSDIVDEIVAVPVGKNASNYHLVLKLNEESGKILELLNRETSVQEIVNEIRKEYAVEEDEAIQHVENFIEQLRNIDLIEE